IRYIGVSNETAFGVMRYLHLAEKHDLPRIVTIQNPYSLLNRSELFLFTKPQNRLLFSGAGFWPIAQAGELAVLMENSSER
ncbi:hypothetical protein MJM95_32245, partial [Salmonella enterica subsp. enterica serovar Anatum]|nr:hypothetical protein [Salmonella enterica subsp. enterica serovar Anatum]